MHLENIAFSSARVSTAVSSGHDNSAVKNTHDKNDIPKYSWETLQKLGRFFDPFAD